MLLASQLPKAQVKVDSNLFTGVNLFEKKSSSLDLGRVIVVGQPWLAAEYPPNCSFTPLCQLSVGEKKMAKLVGQD